MSILTFQELDLKIEFAENEWVEGKVEKTGEPWLEVPAILFYTGTHRGCKYTEDHLQQMEDQFVTPLGDRDWEAPIQLDHSDSAADTIGHIRSVSRRGHELLSRLRFVGEEAVRKVKNGTWKRLSIGLYSNYKIREASVTPFPQLKGAGTYKEGQEPEEKLKGGAEMPTETKEEETKTPTAAEAAAETPPEEPKAAKQEEEPKEPAPAVDQFAEMQARLEAKFAEKTKMLEERLAKSEERAEKADQALRFTELSALVDNYSEPRELAGGSKGVKTTPAMRGKELEFVKLLSEEQLAVYKELKELQPPLVNFSTIGLQELKPPATPENEEAEIAALASALNGK